MASARSAHIDPFCREHLPPCEQWPELWFDRPELQYPEHLVRRRTPGTRHLRWLPGGA
jgi:hypothetical protein